MTKKKTDDKEQAVQMELADGEQSSQENFDGQDSDDNRVEADADTPRESQDGTRPDNADKSLEFALDGVFAGPLDIERKLDEEIAALNAGLPASGQANPETERAPQSPAAKKSKTKPKAPSKRASTAKRKAAKASPVKEDSKAADVAAHDSGRKPSKASGSPQNFYQADYRHLDRGLTEQEQQEWNDIYASFRSQSILTGTVAGVDQNELPVKGPDGKVEMKVISSLVVIGYRVKILIPENAVWFGGEERATFLMRGMIGATVDYVIINIDREGEVALASRGLALVKRRRAFSSGRSSVRPGDIVDCSVFVVGPKRCLLTCGGYDIPMRPIDMSYTSILDMREMYRPGQELKARVITHNPAQGELRISVKEATSNPFDGAERRHPTGSRRQAVITSKYKGGVFCTLADGTVCLCLYSNLHYDSEFMIGDNVIIFIHKYDYVKRHIYGRVVSKW